ncbi:hypothetical protein CBM2599_A10312 [Cupriavidus taiwanensis]|nr:hypothetical protein CBM2599_A10312 [Cupriavidus taiwanensis]
MFSRHADVLGRLYFGARRFAIALRDCQHDFDSLSKSSAVPMLRQPPSWRSLGRAHRHF